MKRYSTDRLPTAIALCVLGGLIAIFTGTPEAGLLVAPWFVLCVLGISQPSRVTVELAVRPADDRVVVGDTIELRSTVTASSDALVTVTPSPEGAYWPSTSTESERRFNGMVDLVTGTEPATIVSELEARQWGSHDLGKMNVEVTLPYGLFHMRGSATRPAMVRVHPTSRELRQLVAPWMVRRLSGNHRSRESAQGVEYADIREYGPGDSVRDINWRVSARSGDLWVSQRHPDRSTDVVLLVDSFVESGHDVRTVFGLVVESALAMAESHLAATDRVGLIEFGGVVRWVNLATGRIQLQRLTDALLATGLYMNAADRELPQLSTRTLPPRSFVIAFTPLLDERFIEAILATRARGHDVAVVECVAPLDQLDLLGTEAVGVATKLWQAERSMLRDRFADQGIAVAQWDGGEYLDVTLEQLISMRRRAVRTGGR